MNLVIYSTAENDIIILTVGVCMLLLHRYSNHKTTYSTFILFRQTSVNGNEFTYYCDNWTKLIRVEMNTTDAWKYSGKEYLINWALSLNAFASE